MHFRRVRVGNWILCGVLALAFAGVAWGKGDADILPKRVERILKEIPQQRLDADEMAAQTSGEASSGLGVPQAQAVPLMEERKRSLDGRKPLDNSKAFSVAPSLDSLSTATWVVYGNEPNAESGRLVLDASGGEYSMAQLRDIFPGAARDFSIEAVVSGVALTSATGALWVGLDADDCVAFEFEGAGEDRQLVFRAWDGGRSVRRAVPMPSGRATVRISYDWHSMTFTGLADTGDGMQELAQTDGMRLMMADGFDVSALVTATADGVGGTDARLTLDSLSVDLGEKASVVARFKAMPGYKKVEFLVILGYLVVLVLVANVFKRFNKNISDYFRNGCRGKWWLVGSSAFMTAFSAWTFTGAAGVAYGAGWSVMIIFLANALGFLLNALFLAPWFRQIRAISPPEVIRLRFGIGTQQFYAYVQFVMQILYSALHLYGLSIFSSAVFNYDVQQVIVVIGCVVLFYSFLGGSWAVMATDFIQSLILLPMTVLVALLCLSQLGGVQEMFDMIQIQGLADRFRVINGTEFQGKLIDFSILWAIAMVLKNVTAYNTLGSAARYFAVKDGNEARKAAWLAFVLMTLGSFIWFIPPVTARLLYAADVNAVNIAKAAEASYAVVSMKLLPLGMSGLMVVAMFAATMSSMDSGLNRNAAIFTNDIYPAICRRMLRHKPLHGAALMRLGQAWTLILGFLIIMTALYLSNQEGRGIFSYMLDIGAIIGVPMSVPLLMGLFVRRAPSWAAVFSIVVTAVPSAMGFFAGKEVAQNVPFLAEPWMWYTKVFLNMGTGITAFFITIPFLSRSDPFWDEEQEAFVARVKAFFVRMRTPVDFEKEVGAPFDARQLLVVGGFCIAIGAAISALILLPGNSWGISGRAGILMVGGTVAIVGVLLYLAGRRSAAVDAEIARRLEGVAPQEYGVKEHEHD